MKDTHLVIVNRGPAITADGWIHIVPKGDLPNREAGITQVLDDVALDSILESIAVDQRRLGDRWPGIYAGREHFIYNDEQDSAALAWFKQFEKRDNGIWARDDGLTDLGREAIANKRYKFTSFVADRRDTQKLDGDRIRILKIDTVGFTNQANGKELLTPITNRAELLRNTLSPYQNPDGTFRGGFDGCVLHMQNVEGHSAASAKRICGYIANYVRNREEFLRPAGAGPAEKQNSNRKEQMKSVATKLGLSADASEEAVLAEVAKLTNRGDITAADLATLLDRAKKLEGQVTVLRDEQIEGLLDLHKVEDEKVRNRFKAILKPLENREERSACLAEFGYEAGAGAQTAQTGHETGQRVLNRAAGKPPGGQGSEQDAARAKADKIRNRASELRSASPGRSWDDCWGQATRELAAK